jgi:hypothetical protein
MGEFRMGGRLGWLPNGRFEDFFCFEKIGADTIPPRVKRDLRVALVVFGGETSNGGGVSAPSPSLAWLSLKG